LGGGLSRSGRGAAHVGGNGRQRKADRMRVAAKSDAYAVTGEGADLTLYHAGFRMFEADARAEPRAALVRGRRRAR